jgi:hypothetical protein
VERGAQTVVFGAEAVSEFVGDMRQLVDDGDGDTGVGHVWVEGRRVLGKVSLRNGIGCGCG